MPKPNAVEAEDKDLPLRDDIRLPGRTVREQSGVGPISIRAITCRLNC
jgi:hypothetical protein